MSAETAITSFITPAKQLQEYVGPHLALRIYSSSSVPFSSSTSSLENLLQPSSSSSSSSPSSSSLLSAAASPVMASVDLSKVYSLDQFQVLAKCFMPKSLYEYVASGTDDEQTLHENRQAFKRFFLLPRMMRDVSGINISLTVYGHRCSMPILVTPAGVHQLMDPEGECATARACQAVGTVFALSQHSTKSLEDVARAAPNSPKWFQLYILKDKALTIAILNRAVAAGYTAICLTIDSVRFGSREADIRNSFNGLPKGYSLGNYPTENGYNDRVKDAWDQNTEKLFDETVTWKEIAWLKSLITLPILVKGVLSPVDATLAVQAGVDGIVVSNHGGRQLDGAFSTIESLEPVITAVRLATPTGTPQIPVFLDSGVRRGTDVMKALALGATAVLLGRPVFFSLALGGEKGVAAMLEVIRQEFEACMALCGCKTLKDIHRGLVVHKEGGDVYQRASL